MRAYGSHRDTPDGMESALVRNDPRISEPRSMRLPNTSTRPGQHRSPVRSAQMPTGLRNGMAELLADIDGLPCACRKSNSHIQMMKSAKKWRRQNATNGMYCSRRRRVLFD
jgi:hypothetical protein